MVAPMFLTEAPKVSGHLDQKFHVGSSNTQFCCTIAFLIYIFMYVYLLYHIRAMKDTAHLTYSILKDTG